MFNKILKYSLFCLFFLFLPQKAFSQEYWRDDFNSIDSAKWTVNERGGTISNVDGILTLSSNSSSYPIFYRVGDSLFNNNGDSAVEIKFRFNNVSAGGAGISIGFTGATSYPFYQFSIWQDYASGGHIVFNSFNKSKYNECSNLCPIQI